MAQYKVKQIDEKRCWVITGKKPLQVKIYKHGSKYVAKCKCDMYLLVNDCGHAKAVRESIKRNWAVPKPPDLPVIEYIGGNIKKQLGSVLKQLSY